MRILEKSINDEYFFTVFILQYTRVTENVHHTLTPFPLVSYIFDLKGSVTLQKKPIQGLPKLLLILLTHIIFHKKYVTQRSN